MTQEERKQRLTELKDEYDMNAAGEIVSFGSAGILSLVAALSFALDAAKVADIKVVGITTAFFAGLGALVGLGCEGVRRIIRNEMKNLGYNDKVQLAKKLAEVKGESTKDHSDYVNKITRNK